MILTKIFKGKDDGGFYYVRQVANKIYWFAEHPDGHFANVFQGTRSGNKIIGKWWDVPKGNSSGRGILNLIIKPGGKSMFFSEASGGFMNQKWEEVKKPVHLFGVREPQFQSNSLKDLDGAWLGNDGGTYYIRQIGDEVTWFGERGYDFSNVFVGKRTGHSIAGKWADVPKASTVGSGQLSFEIKDSKTIILKRSTGGFGGNKWIRTDYPVIYEHKSFKGSSIKIDHNIPDLKALVHDSVLPHRKSSSLYLPPRWEIRGYEKRNFKGPFVSFSTKSSSKGKKFSEFQKWNDKISSIRAAPSPNYPHNRFGSLVITWAAVIDNGEGSKAGIIPGVLHHGPVGRFHVLIYEQNDHSSLKKNRSRVSYQRALRHIILDGPSSHGKSENEWDDGDFMEYDRGLEFFQWRHELDAVTVFIYESDVRKRKGSKRKHDAIFLAKVQRRDTLSSKMFQSPWVSNNDAVSRAERRGGSKLNRILKQKASWNHGIGKDDPVPPKMFLALKTEKVPSWYKDEN